MTLGFIILAILVGATLLLRWICQRVIREYATVHSIWWIGVLIALCGAVLVMYQSHHLQEHERVKSWPTVEGLVVDSKVAGELSYHPEVRYEYEVDGRTYDGTSTLLVPGFGGKRRRDEVALKEIANYWPGRTVTVHYNPADPSVSLLLTRLKWSVYGQLGFGGTLFVLGFLVLLWPRKKRPGKAATDRRSPATA